MRWGGGAAVVVEVQKSGAPFYRMWPAAPARHPSELTFADRVFQRAEAVSTSLTTAHSTRLAGVGTPRAAPRRHT